MKKVVLKTVDLVKFNLFIDSLIPLNDAGTVYFKIDSNGIDTDSHNEAGTIIKSLRMGMDELCGQSNIESVGSPIKLCFYEGKKVKKAFSFLSGNEIKCEIAYSEMEGELYAETLKVSSPKVSITLDAADPDLFEFANVPEESIEACKDTTESDCKFSITTNEIIQIKKFMDFDSSDEVEFRVNGTVKVCSEDSYEIDIADDFGGTNNGNQYVYKIGKDLFNKLDLNNYTVYPNLEDNKIIFVADDGKMETVITLHEEVDL